MNTRILLFILVMSGCIRLQAQAYFDTGYYYYYKSDPFPTRGFGYNLPYTNKLMPVWSDTVIQLTDSIRIYSLFKLINTDLLTQYPVNCTKQDSADGLGQQIETGPGYIRLFNQHYEPITLYMNVDTGFLWTCFRNTDYLINAAVIRINDSTILNKPTKVKTFRLTVFHADSTPFDSNSYNNATISVAEEIGIIECPLINRFPEHGDGYLHLTGVLSKDTKTNLGITNVKRAEDYYEINDEFHSHAIYASGQNGEATGNETYKIWKVLKKEYYQDSVIYSYADIRRVMEWHIYQNHPQDDWDSVYKRIDTGTYVAHSKVRSTADLLEFNSDRIYGVVFPYNECFQVVGYENTFKTFLKIDSCWYDKFEFDEPFYVNIYDGIGSPGESFSYNSFHGTYGDIELIYAKKNNCFWGTPYDVDHLGVDEPEIHNSVMAFPNPTEGVVNIRVLKSISSSDKLSIYDSEGRLMEKDKIRVIKTDKAIITIDISTLTNGLYFLVMESESGHRYNCRMIKN